ANPISPERQVMRHTLLSSILDTLRDALRHRERVLLFEIGRTYLPYAESVLPVERRRLSLALAGPREAPSWLSPASRGSAEVGAQSPPPHRGGGRAGSRAGTHFVGAGATVGATLDYFDLKGIVDTLTQHLHLPDVVLTPSEHPAFHPARAATLSAGGQLIGTFGEL